MSDFDRCIYCASTGCLGGTVVHDSDCPQVTNVYPVTEQEAGARCSSCFEPFTEGGTYTLTSHPEHWMTRNTPVGIETAFVTCLGCAALNREPA